MKSIIFIISLSVIFTNLSYSQIKVANTTGYVKIGSTASPTQPLDVSGNSIFTPGSSSGSLIINNTGTYGSVALYPYYNQSCNIGLSNHAFDYVYSYFYPSPSDARQKENIRDIKNAINLIMQLKGVEYDLKKEIAFPDSQKYSPKIRTKMENDRKNIYGFLAQDALKVLKTSVVFYDDSTDTYTMDYTKIVPILVEAIKLQQSQIDSLRQLNKKGTVSMTSSSVQTNVTTIESEVPVLYQNAPNPFSQKTTIGYYLPEKIQNAVIYIYDMNGGQIRSIPIFSKGAGNVTINGNELRPGMYLYTLIADNQEIATKRMILTQ